MGHLVRHSERYRFALLGGALVLFVAGLLVGLLPTDDWRALQSSGPTLRLWATGLTLLWGLLDAAVAVRRRRAAADREAYVEVVRGIFGHLEDACAATGTVAETTRCSVIVWQVQRLTWGERRRGERRPSLARVFEVKGRGHVPSGLTWRVGMGAIGQSLEQNSALIREIEALWSPLRGQGRDAWEAAGEEVRQGLSFEEFLLVDHDTPGVVGGEAPTVLATPLFRDGRPVGCAALDVPAGMTAALLAAQKVVHEDLTSLAQAVLPGE